MSSSLDGEWQFEKQCFYVRCIHCYKVFIGALNFDDCDDCVRRADCLCEPYLYASAIAMWRKPFRTRAVDLMIVCSELKETFGIT